MVLEEITDSIKTVAVLLGILSIAYSGFMLVTNRDPATKYLWKEAIVTVLVALSIIFAAPILASIFDGNSYCR